MSIECEVTVYTRQLRDHWSQKLLNEGLNKYYVFGEKYVGLIFEYDVPGEPRGRYGFNITDRYEKDVPVERKELATVPSGFGIPARPASVDIVKEKCIELLTHMGETNLIFTDRLDGEPMFNPLECAELADKSAYEESSSWGLF